MKYVTLLMGFDEICDPSDGLMKYVTLLMGFDEICDPSDGFSLLRWRLITTSYMNSLLRFTHKNLLT